MVEVEQVPGQMDIDECIEEAEKDEAKDDHPPIAHWAWPNSPTMGLCGTPIRGLPAPANCQVCVVCEDLRP